MNYKISAEVRGVVDLNIEAPSIGAAIEKAHEQILYSDDSCTLANVIDVDVFSAEEACDASGDSEGVDEILRSLKEDNEANEKTSEDSEEEEASDEELFNSMPAFLKEIFSMLDEAEESSNKHKCCCKNCKHKDKDNPTVFTKRIVIGPFFVDEEE